MSAIIKKRKSINVRNGAILVVGLPGLGFVGRIAAKYLIDKLGGKKFATLVSSDFPPQALITKKGKIRALQHKFYLVNLEDRDVVVLVGDVQPLTPKGQFDLSLSVVEFCKELGVEEIITIGGYATGRLEDNIHVLGASNNKRHIEKFKEVGVVYGEAKGSIVGMAGMIPALAKYSKVPATCLMAETHGAFVDATGAKRVLEVLRKYIGFDIDYSDLDKATKETEKIIKKIEEEIKKQEEMSKEGSKTPSYIR